MNDDDLPGWRSPTWGPDEWAHIVLLARTHKKLEAQPADHDVEQRLESVASALQGYATLATCMGAFP